MWFSIHLRTWFTATTLPTIFWLLIHKDGLSYIPFPLTYKGRDLRDFENLVGIFIVVAYIWVFLTFRAMFLKKSHRFAINMESGINYFNHRNSREILNHNEFSLDQCHVFSFHLEKSIIMITANISNNCTHLAPMRYTYIPTHSCVCVYSIYITDYL